MALGWRTCSPSGGMPKKWTRRTGIPSWISARWAPTPSVEECTDLYKSSPSFASRSNIEMNRGILGYGAIGRQVARLASAMGMEIYVFTNNPRPTPESRVDGARYCVPGTGDPEGLIPSRWFSGSLDEFLAQDLDIVVVAAGLTDDTRGMIGKRQLEIMGGEGKRKKAFLTNVARGPVVQTDALVEALEQDVIAGAALDVTDPEPLPEGHPLWKAPNVFITPHIAWQSKNVMARSADLLLANLTRLDKGEPLLNVIKDR